MSESDFYNLYFVAACVVGFITWMYVLVTVAQEDDIVDTMIMGGFFGALIGAIAGALWPGTLLALGVHWLVNKR